MQGAKDKLKEIGKERADLEIQRQEQEKIIQKDAEEAKSEVHVSGREGKSMDMGTASLRSKHKADLAKTKEDLAALDKKRDAICSHTAPPTVSDYFTSTNSILKFSSLPAIS